LFHPGRLTRGWRPLQHVVHLQLREFAASRTIGVAVPSTTQVLAVVGTVFLLVLLPEVHQLLAPPRVLVVGADQGRLVVAWRLLAPVPYVAFRAVAELTFDDEPPVVAQRVGREHAPFLVDPKHGGDAVPR